MSKRIFNSIRYSDRVSLDIKNVVAAAIKGGTDAVVLCHNHPNGVALPSLEDMDATGSIARALGRYALGWQMISSDSSFSGSSKKKVAPDSELSRAPMEPSCSSTRILE